MRLQTTAENNNHQCTYGRIFALFLNTLLIVDLVRMMTGDSAQIQIAIQYGAYGIIAAYVYLHVLLKYSGKIRMNVFAIICFLLIMLLFSYLACPSISQVFSYFIPLLIVRIIPAILFVSYLKDESIKVLFVTLEKYRLIWLVYALIGTYYISVHSVSWGQYASNFGFNLLLPAGFSLYKFLQEKKPKWIMYAVLFAMFIAIRGSRAALLCFVAFAALCYIMHFSDKLTGKKIFKFGLLVVLAIVIAWNFTEIMRWLGSLFPSSRTFRLLSEDFKFDSGRGRIQELFVNEIKHSPFAFRGFFSDRVFYASATGSKFDITGYPHSFVIEILYQFGVIIGAVLLVMMTIYSIKAIATIHKSDRSELKCLFLLFFVSGILRLFFSGSYLNTIEFYLYLGLIMTALKI